MAIEKLTINEDSEITNILKKEGWVKGTWPTLVFAKNMYVDLDLKQRFKQNCKSYLVVHLKDYICVCAKDHMCFQKVKPFVKEYIELQTESTGKWIVSQIFVARGTVKWQHIKQLFSISERKKIFKHVTAEHYYGVTQWQGGIKDDYSTTVLEIVISRRHDKSNNVKIVVDGVKL